MEFSARRHRKPENKVRQARRVRIKGERCAEGLAACGRPACADDARSFASSDVETGTGGASDPEFRTCPFKSQHLVGKSRGFVEALATALRVADSSATVLLCGESGTGKELLARAIHRHSDRAVGPYLPINCAAIPENLLESELFGHERGAFTGAQNKRRGRFERASGGTLFLDEIADMSLPLQAKILRVLEEKEVERLGGEQSIAVDVRLIAATNCNLRDRVRDGLFRDDLFYRLAIVVIHIPPLRERGDDVLVLTEYFLKLFACEIGRPVPQLHPAVLSRLYEYPWPGNVRELRNVIQRTMLLADGGTILEENLPPEILDSDVPVSVGTADPVGDENAEPVPPPLSVIEARHIRRVLANTRGHLGRAAEILGIHRNTLRRKIQEHGLEF